MIKRTSKNHIEKNLSLKPNWKILDIGCGYNANKYANVVCDVQNLTEVYKDKTFIQLTEKNLPFKGSGPCYNFMADGTWPTNYNMVTHEVWNPRTDFERNAQLVEYMLENEVILSMATHSMWTRELRTYMVHVFPCWNDMLLSGKN